MAGEFNPGFHHQGGALYKSGGGGMSNSSSSGGSGGGRYDLIPLPNYYSSPRGSLNLGAVDGGLHYFSPQNNSAGPSSSSPLLLDSVPGLKHDTGLAVEWSVEEQFKLEEGLAK